MHYSMRQAARKLGLPVSTLSNYVVLRKIPIPESITTGGITVYLWTEQEISHVRQLLPKIANGRKTRYSKLRAKQKAQPKKAAPRKPKKKK